MNTFKKVVSAISVAALMVAMCGCGQNQREESIKYISEKYSASNDNQLIVYTSHKEEVYLPIIREFEARTGIWVEIHAGGTAQMLSQVRQASENGQCDIMFGGGIESYEAQSDLFMPYESSESKSLDSAYVSNDNIYTPFTELPIVFIYNNKLVSKDAAPKSFRELFDLRWKGKIAFADPNSSGTSYTIVSTMEQIFNEKIDTLVPRLYEQLGGEVLSSSGNVIPKVSDGTYLVGITLEETAKKYMETSDDISMIYPEDGTSAVPDGCAMVKNAPHSYNAGKFIDFVVSSDVQEYAVNNYHRRSVREDIVLPNEYGDIKIIYFDIRKSAGEEADFFTLWNSLTP